MDSYTTENYRQDPKYILRCMIQKNFNQDPNRLNLYLLDNQQYMHWNERLGYALKDTMAQLLTFPFYKFSKKSDVNIEAMQKACIKMMGPVNEINWQQQILQNIKFDKKGNPLSDRAFPDIESIELGQAFEEIRRKSTLDKRLFFPSTNSVANLYSSIMVNHKGEHRAIKRAPTNIRTDRIRPEQIHKSNGTDLIPAAHDPVTKKKWGAYGLEWAIQVKGDKREKGITLFTCTQPSFAEVINGVVNWNIAQARKYMEGQSPQVQKKIILARNNKLKVLKAAINISNTEEPLKAGHFDGDDFEIGLRNPYSKVTCFILYLYSMQFGDPPLFAEMNRVARDMDMSELTNLGPILRALSVITWCAEKSRDSNDRIKTGEEVRRKEGGCQQNLGGAYLLYRGARMKNEWLDLYRQNIKAKYHLRKQVKIPGNTSCSDCLKVALDFSGASEPKKDFISVIFVFCLQNYETPNGIRMNNEAYTSFPVEGETLFTEGLLVWVLDIENNVEIINSNAGYTQFNGKMISIVYLYHDTLIKNIN